MIRSMLVLALLAASGAGCHMLPREDLNAFAEELRPPEDVAVDEDAAAGRIASRTGVEAFEPSQEVLTDPPPVPSWAMFLMRLMVDDD